MMSWEGTLDAARCPGRIRIALAGFATAIWTLPVGADIHRVAPDGTGDHLTVQSAIDAAGSGDTLRIGPGTYPEHVRLVNKQLLLEGTAGAAATRLDGNSSGRVVTIVSPPGTVVLRGLTIARGIMNGVESYDQGGGVAAFVTDLVVEDCVFLENFASSRGGGLVLSSFIPSEELTEPPGPSPGSRLTVRRTSFLSNFSGGSGGGIHLDEVPSLIQDAEFIRNHAGQTGGGLDMSDRDHRIERCRFEDNDGFLGAGAAFAGQGVLSLSDVIFRSNTADNFGGGLWVVNGSGAVLERVRFFQNLADRGGGLFLARTPLLAGRLLFRDNEALDRGGGAYLDDSPSARFDRSTWFGNAAPNGSALWIFSGELLLTRSIVADPGPQATGCFGSALMTTSCTVGGPTTGECLTFAARTNLTACPVSEELLCSIPTPGTCGPVGYSDTACAPEPCTTPVQPSTWGAIKSRYGP